MFAAYAMILAALITFVLFQRDLPRAWYSAGVLLLIGMFVLHVVQVDIEERLGVERGGLLHLTLNGALWLGAVWVSHNGLGFNFVPFLLFMLVAQAVVTLSTWQSALYAVVLILGLSGAFWLKGFSLAVVITNILSLSTGLVFVLVFSAVLSLYRQQTERANTLLAQLTAANAQLEQARQRERDLAVAEERVRIARDIHDGLGHHLTALNVQLQAAARLAERDPARAAAAISTSRELAQAALAEVRQSVAAMRRTPLDGRSLPDALAALAADFSRRVDLEATVAIGGEPVDLAPAAAQTLYRAAQEGLTNAQKHGGARRVQITLWTADGGRTAGGQVPPHDRAALVILTVVDDGAGGAAEAGGGFGLAGLRERAGQLGGRLVAGPGAGGGFVLRLELPYQERSDDPNRTR